MTSGSSSLKPVTDDESTLIGAQLLELFRSSSLRTIGGQDTIATSSPVSWSMEGRRIRISGVPSRRLYVRLVRGPTLILIRPSVVDWLLGRIFGWWR